MISTVLNEFLKRSVAPGSSEPEEEAIEEGSDAPDDRKVKGKGKAERQVRLRKLLKSNLPAQFKASMLIVSLRSLVIPLLLKRSQYSTPSTIT